MKGKDNSFVVCKIYFCPMWSISSSGQLFLCIFFHPGTSLETSAEDKTGGYHLSPVTPTLSSLFGESTGSSLHEKGMVLIKDLNNNYKEGENKGGEGGNFPFF